MKLRDLVPNSYIHVSVNDLCFSRMDLPIWLQQNRQTNLENICINHSQIYMNVEIERQNIIILFSK